MIWTPSRLLYYAIFEALRKAAKPLRVPVPVICVGNLSMGGTGKTPLVIYLAKRLLDKKVAVLSRGYKGKGRGTREVLVDSDPREVGDEPILIKREVGCPVFVDRNRARAARVAVERGAGALVLDDGFQHRGIEKDVSILVFSHADTRPHLLPWGKWREPLSAAKRADLAVINFKEKGFGELPEVGVRAVAMRYVPGTRLAGRRLFGFSGLGDNASFVRTLRAWGADIAGFKGFPDHHFYSRRELENLLARARALGAVAATSSKDMVRVPRALREEILEVRIRVELRPQDALSFIHGRCFSRSDGGPSR